jgi:DNA-binding XRE family transcriptional regulator
MCKGTRAKSERFSVASLSHILPPLSTVIFTHIHLPVTFCIDFLPLSSYPYLMKLNIGFIESTRKSQNITKANFAKAVGMTPHGLHKALERGTTNFTTVRKMAEALDVSEELLIDFTE